MKHLDTIENINKTPPKTKISYTKYSSNILPHFVMECQRAIRIHHQKEVAKANIEDTPHQLSKHGSHQANPSKADHESPKRS